MADALGPYLVKEFIVSLIILLTKSLFQILCKTFCSVRQNHISAHTDKAPKSAAN